MDDFLFFPGILYVYFIAKLFVFDFENDFENRHDIQILEKLLKIDAFDFGEPKKKKFQHDVNRAISIQATTPPVLGVYGPSDANGFPGIVCDSRT